MAKHDRVVTRPTEVPRRSSGGALLAGNALPARIALLSVLSVAAALGTVPVAALGGLAVVACLLGAFEVRALRAARGARRPVVRGGRRPVVRLA